MDEEMEIKQIVEESLRDISESQSQKIRNPFKSLRLKKKKIPAEGEEDQVGASSKEKPPKVKKAKSEKVSKNFTIRGGLGRRRKVSDKKSPVAETTPESLKRQTPEGGNPLSVSDATLSEIEPEKAQEIPNTASSGQSERIELPQVSGQGLEDEKPHRVETVADRVSVFQQHTKKSTSSIRSKIAKRFHIIESQSISTVTESKEDPQGACMQEPEASKDAEETGKQQSPNFNIGTAVRPPQNLALLRHITSLESDSEDLSGFSSIEEPKKSPVSERSLRKIAYVAQTSFSTSQEDTLSREKTLEIGQLEKSPSEHQGGTEGSSDLKKMPAHGDLIADNVWTNMTPSGQTSGGKKEHLYKILVIGELGTGKTSFIKRYVHQFFSNNYRATIGVDFALKVIPWDENTIVRLQLWDIAGQERFGNMTRVYYKEAVGAFIVFDVTRSATFDAVAKWKQDLDAKVQLPDGSNIPCVLLANKCDQEKQGFVCNSAKMDEYVRENKFTAWFETSAKENINIEESAKALVTKILINDKTIVADPADDEKVMLTNSTHSTSKSCAC